MPLTHKYVEADPHFIKLQGDRERINYDHLLQEYYLAKLYLKHPAYFFKRSEGREKLIALADRGYIPAISQLITFHNVKALHATLKDPVDERKHIHHYNAAYKWAFKAAELGNYTNLHMMFQVYKPYEHRDVAEDLTLLEKGALEMQSDILATDLSVYYFTQGAKEKEDKWLEIAEQIYYGPKKEPACVTIEPRKTHTGFYTRWEELDEMQEK